MNKENKFYLTANLEFHKETDAMRKEVASVIDLPKEEEKQPDLSYFSAILVSSGENLNHAYFLGSELVAASDTIVSKALDVEHEEQEIIGHIYSNAFTDGDHNPLDLVELSSNETASLDAQDMHIQIGCVVYKNRFPDLAKEISNKDYKVSMECYYQDFDIKIGNTIIPKAAAEAIGIETSNSDIFGKTGKVIQDNKEVASGTVARVLRGICFSGCGIVKNPANPPSVILETASDDDNLEVIFNLDKINENKEEIIDKLGIINVTSKEVEHSDNEVTTLDIINTDKKVGTNDSDESNDLPFTELKATTVSYVDKLFDKQSVNKEMTNSLDRLERALKKANSYRSVE